MTQGYDCEVTMLAHGGWYLWQHLQEPEVQFNIRYGHYDYVVLQEYSHPFGPVEDFRKAAVGLNELIREAGSTPVIFVTWAPKGAREKQEYMNEVHRQIAEEIGALVAPVGEEWWGYMKSWPDLEMYNEDGEHASFAGSDFAAKMIWNTIYMDLARKRIK